MRRYLALAVALIVGIWLGRTSSLSFDLWGWLRDQAIPLMGLGAVGTGLAVVVAVVGIPFAAQQLALQRRTASDQSSRECLWRFTDVWRQEIAKPPDGGGLSEWGRANAALKEGTWKLAAPDPDGFTGKPDYDVIGVLNFFDGVATMLWMKQMDEVLAYDKFSANLEVFYESAKPFLQAYWGGQIKRRPDTKLNEVDDSYWTTLQWWMSKSLPQAAAKAADRDKKILAAAKSTAKVAKT